MDEDGMLVGVVHHAGGVAFVTASATRRELYDGLGDYVESRAAYQLYPAEAAVVQGLLRRGFSERAVRYYFEHVGRRWDRERLHLQHIAMPAATVAPWRPLRLTSARTASLRGTDASSKG